MIQIGAASRAINGEVGALVQGASVDNRAERIRDDMEANALYLSDRSESVLLVSCDLAGLEAEGIAPAREAMGEAAGVPARNVIVAATHMHSGPCVIPTNPAKPVDRAYLARLHDGLV